MTRLTTELEQSRARENEFRQLSDWMQKELDEHKVWLSNTQRKFMDALEDRGTFEAECKTAKAKAETLTASLDSARKQNEMLKEIRKGKEGVYICEGFTCGLPIVETEALNAKLDEQST